MAVFIAVSNPMVESVPYMSLSMVPGRPIIGRSNSSEKICAPVNVPSPPMQTKPSTPACFKLRNAFLRPSFIINSSERDV